jgi:glycosyltransferase involved in cell wall biosynthesis
LLRSKAPYNPRTFLIRHGVDYEHFSQALDAATVVPREVADLPRPVLGYFGLLSQDWVDIDLLEGVARHFAQGSLVLLGRVAMDLGRLQRLPNVHILGHKPYTTLPSYCKGFDVGLVPFPISEVTLNANPLKVREYLAAGLPVVSTPIPEVEAVGACHLAGDVAGFVGEVEKAIAEPTSRADRSASMRCERWEARVELLRQHLAALP